ncbi:hypothetical protein RRG08_031955 [Elysia crispata]|uniref:Uncharacterized protein n=1 Tax=Elysia crispata TaxID=231223 RepID=A0AAE0Z5C2_9GAST|nr:hypothetical protein RRG08_031955 [Elysia crispata]
MPGLEAAHHVGYYRLVTQRAGAGDKSEPRASLLGGLYHGRSAHQFGRRNSRLYRPGVRQAVCPAGSVAHHFTIVSTQLGEWTCSRNGTLFVTAVNVIKPRFSARLVSAVGFSYALRWLEVNENDWAYS